MLVMGQAETAGELIQKADQAYNRRFDLPAGGDFRAALKEYEPWLKAAIDYYEQAWQFRAALSVQSQAHVANRLAQLKYELTTYLDKKRDQEEIDELLREGKTFGFESLKLNPGFDEERFVETLKYVKDVAALLWTADCWGAWLGYHPLEGFVNISKVKAIYERAVELDETYWGASSHNALGALLITTPGFLGGNVEEGKGHLERAIELAPDYLINHTVYAEYWGFTYDMFGNKSGLRDQGLIERELNLVLQAPIGDSWPFWNREAKREAEILLEELERRKRE